MRTTIDIPDPVFRETKALAAMRGITLKQLILEAIEQAKNGPVQAAQLRAHPQEQSEAPKFPSFHLRSRRPLNLSNFDFDDLLT